MRHARKLGRHAASFAAHDGVERPADLAIEEVISKRRSMYDRKSSTPVKSKASSLVMPSSRMASKPIIPPRRELPIRSTRRL